MDITEIVKLIAKMTGMNEKEQEQLESFIEQFDDIDEINSFSDLEDIDFSELDIEGFDLDSLDMDGFDYDPGLGKRPGKRSVDDYRHNPDQASDDEEEQIDVNIPDNHDEDSGPYQGNTWMEVEDSRFEAFVEIPEELDNSEVDISLRNNSVHVSEPIGETLNTEHLPVSVTNLDAEVTEGGRLMIKVW